MQAPIAPLPAAVAAATTRSPARHRHRRTLARLLLGFSLLLLLVDVLATYSQGSDVDLEALARLLLIVVAFIAVRSSAHDHVWLLIWGLIGTSFDTFWSAAGNHPAWLREAMMVVKYLAVPAGLAALLRFTAEFGGADCDIGGIRCFIRRLAWPLGVLLAAAGLTHGITYLAGCVYVAPKHDFFDCQPFVESGFLAYLSADIFVRIVIVVAAVMGLLASHRMRRQFLVLGASCAIFALGGAVDFLARVLPSSRLSEILSGESGQIVNAACSVAFPVGLLIAVQRRELYDVRYLVHKTTVITIVMTLLGSLWYGLQQLVEVVLHRRLLELVVGVTDGLPHPSERMIDIVVGFLVALLYKPAERLVSEIVEKRLFPDRGRCLHVLRQCVDRLQAVTDRPALDALLARTAIACGIVPFNVFKVCEDERFVSLIPPDAAFDVRFVADDRRLARLREGKIAKEGIGSIVPGAVLAVPFVLRGRLIAVVACGAPMRFDPPEFEAAEERELCNLARETGAALYAMGELTL